MAVCLTSTVTHPVAVYCVSFRLIEEKNSMTSQLQYGAQRQAPSVSVFVLFFSPPLLPDGLLPLCHVPPQVGKPEGFTLASPSASPQY